MSRSITEAQWLDSLRAAFKNDGGGLSAADIASKLNLSVPVARRIIKEQIEAGVLSPGRGWTARMDGLMTKIPVYRLVAKKFTSRTP